MFDLSTLPDNIASKIEDVTYTLDDFGCSGSTIMLFDKIVLKIEKISHSSEHELKLLNWLHGKLPVPKIIGAETRDGCSFLLMSRLPDEMTCSENSMKDAQHTAYAVKALAKALKMLWSVDIRDCPFSNVLSEKLAEATRNIKNGLVDVNDFQPETLGPGGFKDVWDLYGYLESNRPEEDLVFSHGDFCLPNVFASGEDVTGFLDWGTGGAADRWQDIALCVRSLRYNCVHCAGYSEADYQKYRALLFRELGMEPDEEKIRYYILLDELF
ncbi:MAG: aminoglycoside 3'-phosphotransferase [Defluviitaleaceae bacterium]|nr:aminoglycoside 3'-phosphotransferase [Defluviitaleaceae bacterium]